MIRTEVNCTTGEVTEITLTAEEVAAVLEVEALRIATIPAPVPPTVAEQLAKLDTDNALSQRNLRDTILLMSEAFKTLSGGALDLAQLPGVAKVAQVEAQAAELRALL